MEDPSSHLLPDRHQTPVLCFPQWSLCSTKMSVEQHPIYRQPNPGTERPVPLILCQTQISGSRISIHIKQDTLCKSNGNRCLSSNTMVVGHTREVDDGTAPRSEAAVSTAWLGHRLYLYCARKRALSYATSRGAFQRAHLSDFLGFAVRRFNSCKTCLRRINIIDHEDRP